MVTSQIFSSGSSAIHKASFNVSGSDTVSRALVSSKYGIAPYRAKKHLFHDDSKSSSDFNFLQAATGGFFEKRNLETDIQPSGAGKSKLKAVEITGFDLSSTAQSLTTHSERSLSSLAANGGQCLKVMDKGDMLYVLHQDDLDSVAQNSIKRTLKPYSRAITDFGQNMVRIMFGSETSTTLAMNPSAISALLPSVQSKVEGDQKMPESSLYVNPFDLPWYWDPCYSSSFQLSRDGLYFSATVQSPPPPPRQKAGSENGDDYHVNVGYAIRTIRDELPSMFYKDLTYDIYRDDIVFRDPLNTFSGIDNYKLIFWALRFHGKIFFKALWVDVINISEPRDKVILVRWCVKGLPRVPWESQGHFDGTSEFKLDKNGKIFEHKVDNVVMNNRKTFAPLSVIDLLRLAGARTTPTPSYCRQMVEGAESHDSDCIPACCGSLSSTLVSTEGHVLT